MRDAIEGWLKLGRIKPTIDDLTIGLTWSGADLFGELAVQIALAANAMDGQVLCVACGKEYLTYDSLLDVARKKVSREFTQLECQEFFPSIACPKLGY